MDQAWTSDLVVRTSHRLGEKGGSTRVTYRAEFTEAAANTVRLASGPAGLHQTDACRRGRVQEAVP
ncbi:hypothetical protein ACFOWZ_05470 [Lentzea rhizosphaerae]|uniref:Uncharacterized protein n=1 Tax=Lentzea rhizosphaerae TaxID=2041025 RepID=A0ABV8BNP8_9PSEU